MATNDKGGFTAKEKAPHATPIFVPQILIAVVALVTSIFTGHSEHIGIPAYVNMSEGAEFAFVMSSYLFLGFVCEVLYSASELKYKGQTRDRDNHPPVGILLIIWPIVFVFGVCLCFECVGNRLVAETRVLLGQAKEDA